MDTQSWQQGVPGEDWDELQTNLGAHFLQRSAWAAFQASLGHEVFYAAGDGWSWTAILERRRLGSRLYAPYGPTATTLATLKKALASLTECARAHKAVFVRIEPFGPFVAKDMPGLGLGKIPRGIIQPQHTLVLDLSAPEDELLADMTSSNRNLHRTASKKGLGFRASSDPADVKIFLKMIHAVAARNGILPHSDKYYTQIARELLPRGAGKIYVAEHQGKPVAASIVFDSPTTRYYAHAGSLPEARKLSPGNPLLVRMILDAQAAGQKQFDFFGIAPPDQPEHPWAGFTKFKQSFGGRPVEFAGTWELPVQRAQYLLFSSLRRIKG